MPKIPIVTTRKLRKVLKKKGFALNRIHGSHHIYVHPNKKLTVSIPVHAGHDLGRGLILGILKDAQISVDEFLKLI